MLAKTYQANLIVLALISLLSLKINKDAYNFYRKNKSSKLVNQLIALLLMDFIIIVKYHLVLLLIRLLCC